MNNILLQLGVGGTFALLVIQTVLNHLRHRNSCSHAGELPAGWTQRFDRLDAKLHDICDTLGRIERTFLRRDDP